MESGASTVYDAVRMLRPSWLPRQPGSEIYILLVDGSQGETPRLVGRLSSRQQISFLDPYEEIVRERDWDSIYEIGWMGRTEAAGFGYQIGSTRGGSRLLGAIVIRTIPFAGS